jgi:hypothetical protein
MREVRKHPYLDLVDAVPYQFGDFESKLLLRDGFSGILIVCRQDLVIAFVEMGASMLVFVSLTFDFPMLRPAISGRELRVINVSGVLEKPDSR